jgi:Spy/CpxP family protein refolding chaperone
MNPRTAFISITVLVAACAVGYTQLPEQPTTSARIPPANVPAISPRPVREPSLDQMLDELEALRAQKAQIEKKEAELSRAIREKAAAQAERMNRLGSVRVRRTGSDGSLFWGPT